MTVTKSEKGILKSTDIIPPSIIKELTLHAEKTIDSLHQDYFSEKSKNDFLTNHFNKEGVFAKLASLRFANSIVMDQLLQYIIPLANDLYGEDDYWLHPIFYLRLSSPEFYQSAAQKAALLDSQPHYDRPFGLKAFTFWIPLETADEDTGCLCDFTGENFQEIENYFLTPWEKPNRHNYDGYLDNIDKLDEMLKKGVNVPYAKVGDVLGFNWNVLHGATRPVNKRRLSFDFRLVPGRHLKDSPERSVRVLEKIRESVDLCSAYNMMSVSDYKGAARAVEYFSKKNNNTFFDYLPDLLKDIPVNNEILRPLSPFSWRKEFSFVK